MSGLTLYHGSPNIIETPIYGEGKVYNDYGRGFYCTQHLELAKEWACTEGVDGYANQYEICLDGLNILNLSEEQYTILHWLTILVEHRKIRISTAVVRRGIEWLKLHYHIDISAYDAIIGYRADDAYFSFARAFLNNEISITQLSYAMRLGKLGEQFVLKSPKAFDAIRFVTYHNADNAEYYSKRQLRNEAAQEAFQIEMDRDDIDGLYMRDIIREEVMPNDPRLRQ